MHPVQFHHIRAAGRQPPADHLDAPSSVVLAHADQVVAAEGLALVVIGGRAGGDPENRYANISPLAPDEAVAMHVAVYDEFGAMALENGLDRVSVGHAAVRRGLSRQRRMVDHHDTREPTGAEVLKERCEPRELLAPDPTRRDERARLDRRIDADQRDIADPAHVRKPAASRWCGKRLTELVRPHVGAPGFNALVAAQARVDVVVAGNDAHHPGIAQGLEPDEGRLVFRR